MRTIRCWSELEASMKVTALFNVTNLRCATSVLLWCFFNLISSRRLCEATPNPHNECNSTNLFKTYQSQRVIEHFTAICKGVDCFEISTCAFVCCKTPFWYTRMTSRCGAGPRHFICTSYHLLFSFTYYTYLTQSMLE
jgi:hypothetical protein